METTQLSVNPYYEDPIGSVDNSRRIRTGNRRVVEAIFGSFRLSINRYAPRRATHASLSHSSSDQPGLCRIDQKGIPENEI